MDLKCSCFTLDLRPDLASSLGDRAKCHEGRNNNSPWNTSFDSLVFVGGAPENVFHVIFPLGCMFMPRSCRRWMSSLVAGARLRNTQLMSGPLRTKQRRGAWQTSRHVHSLPLPARQAPLRGLRAAADHSLPAVSRTDKTLLLVHNNHGAWHSSVCRQLKETTLECAVEPLDPAVDQFSSTCTYT